MFYKVLDILNCSTNILRNTFYKGKVLVPSYKGVAEHLVEGKHQALVSEEVFDNDQEIMDGKKKKKTKLNSTMLLP